MNVYQVIFGAFTLLTVAMIAWAMLVISRSSKLKYKPLWIAGTLVGFPVGLGINWTVPDDLVLLFGIHIPLINAVMVISTGQLIIKILFPMGTIAALIAAREASKNAEHANSVPSDDVR